MLKLIKYIFGSVLIIFIGFNIYKNHKPKTYDSNFNKTREKVGLETIEPDWIQHNSENAVYQIWTPKEIDKIGFYKKYTNCYSWNGAIVSEIDIYRVNYDSTIVILSIHYKFQENQKNKSIIKLKELSIPSNKDELFGYPSYTIRTISKDEAKIILSNNGISKDWP